MITFKEFMAKFTENLWGNIPATTRKPSDGIPNADKLSMSSNSGGSSGPGSAVQNPLGKSMMKKKMSK